MCQNPKGSNVYSTNESRKHTTRLGSHYLVCCGFYKHSKPSACLMVDKIKRRRNDISRKEPDGVQMFLTQMAIRHMCQNPKGSNVYSTNGDGDIRPRLGSHFLVCCRFYKHGKPTVCLMVDKIKRRRNDISRKEPDGVRVFLTQTAVGNMRQNPKGSNVYSKNGNTEHSTPTGSHIGSPCFLNIIPFGIYKLKIN